MRYIDRRYVNLCYVLFFGLIVTSIVPLISQSIGSETPPEEARLHTTITRVWMNGTDTMLNIRVYQTVNWQHKHLSCDLIELKIDDVSHQHRLVWWETNWTQPGEFYMIILNNTAPYPDVEFPINWCDWIEHRSNTQSQIIVKYNMGEVTGTQKVSARAQMFMQIEYTPLVAAYRQSVEFWGPWSSEVTDVVPEPLPLIEIASVIGAGGIA